VLTGQFNAASLKTFLKASGKAGKLKAHYLKYPRSSADFQPWETEALRLWKS
jgi:hypothetical protein